MTGDLPILHPLTRWADTLKLGEHILRKWVADGWLEPSVVSGRVRLYSPADIEYALDKLQESRIDEVDVIRRLLRDSIIAKRPVIGTEDPWPAGVGEAP